MTAALTISDLVDMAIPSLPKGRRGSPALPPTFVREMTPADVQHVLTTAAPRQQLQRIRHTHHLAARLLAEGRSNVEVADIVALSPVRICQLKNDPAFQELVEHYKTQVNAKYVNFHEKLAGLGMAFVDELAQRLEEEPDKFSNDEVMRALEKLLDRGGFGPKSVREVNLNARSFALSVVETIKSEHKAAGRVLEVQTLLEESNA